MKGQINGFSDLCVPFTSDKKVMVEIVKQLIQFGYRNVAIEQQVDFTDEHSIPKIRDIFPAPENLQHLEEFKQQINILTRLTIVYNNQSISHYMTNSANVKKFDIVAGMPTTDQALQHCCQTFNGDLVCFAIEKAHISFSRKYYNLAVERKMFFEICYAPAIIDSNHRRHIIRRAHAYHSYGKSQNIVISSGAVRQIELRTPYEVANLGLLFGLVEEQAKTAMAGNCRQVLIRATGRRHNKAVMVVEVAASRKSESEDEEDDDFMDTGDEQEEKADGDDDGGEDEEEEQQPVKKKKMN